MPRRLHLLLSSALFALLLTLAHSPSALAQPRPQGATTTAGMHLKWQGQEGVLRYRLQVARDEQFQDIVFDRAVFGTEYVVPLTPGIYYWHVAPAVKETGTFTPARRFEFKGEENVDAGGEVRPIPSQMPTQPSWATTGWRTTTGPISMPMVAHLRSASGVDIVGVNADGMVYGLDGTNGVALWVSRFRPNAKRGEPTGNGGAPTFTPVLVEGKNGLVNVVVGFEGGVRALEGATGRELWRSSLVGSPVSGAVVTPEGGGARALLIASDKSTSLTILNPENGKTVSEVKFDSPPVAAPAPFPLGNGMGAIFSLEGGTLDVRNSAGERVRAVRMDTAITTPALVVNGPRGTLVLVGTESGLISLSAEDLKPIGRIATEGDAPTGTLAAADLDGDGAPEALLVTRRGRVASIGTTDGKIKWHNMGAGDAAGVAFADLNGDGVLDVLVAAGADFARAFDGRDGTPLAWRTEEDARNAAKAPPVGQTRLLVVGRFGDGAGVYVVGTDPARTGLRAIGLPKDSVKASRE